MTTLYVFLQWARPAWLLIILASAVSVGLLLTVLSMIHNWLADQFFMLDDGQTELEPMISEGLSAFTIPVSEGR